MGWTTASEVKLYLDHKPDVTILLHDYAVQSSTSSSSTAAPLSQRQLDRKRAAEYVLKCHEFDAAFKPRTLATIRQLQDRLAEATICNQHATTSVTSVKSTASSTHTPPTEYTYTRTHTHTHTHAHTHTHTHTNKHTHSTHKMPRTHSNSSTSPNIHAHGFD